MNTTKIVVTCVAATFAVTLTVLVGVSTVYHARHGYGSEDRRDTVTLLEALGMLFATGCVAVVIVTLAGGGG